MESAYTQAVRQDLVGVELTAELVKLAGDLVDQVQRSRGEKDRELGALAIDLEETDVPAAAARRAQDDVIEGDRFDGLVRLEENDVAASRVLSIPRPVVDLRTYEGVTETPMVSHWK